MFVDFHGKAWENLNDIIRFIYKQQQPPSWKFRDQDKI